MKTVLKIVGVVLILLVISIGGLGFYITRGLETGSKLEMGDVDLLALEDGTYVGQHEAGRFSNKVSVEVKDHKIIQIDILEDLRFNKDEVTNEVIDKVVNEQSPNIDAISGSTVSSKAYLKAIENALKK